MGPESKMRAESIESADAVARMLRHDHDALAALIEDLHRQAPAHIVTIARGSSDHAAAYFAYLCMLRLGRYVTSLPPSLITLFNAPLQQQGVLALIYSQSGRSPDLVRAAGFFHGPQSRCVAIVNDAQSPVAAQAQTVLPLHAGVEASVAATKSFITQLVAGARLVALWQQDGLLLKALDQLPQALSKAASTRWDRAVQTLVAVDRLMVVSRGSCMGVAYEVALKLKEACGIQAEPFSSAEVRHGPMTLIDAGYPLLILAPRGPAQPELLSMAHEMRQRGAKVLVAACGRVDALDLPCVDAPHEDLDPVCMIQSFYLMVEALARARGRDPDEPAHLSKVTLTT